MPKLTRQGVRDLGGNTALPPPVCSHQHGTRDAYVDEMCLSSLFGEYVRTVKTKVCRKCGKEIDR